jgi:protoporphyrinogen oxidase
MMWERCATRVREMGGSILLGRKVVGCSLDYSTQRWTVTARDASGNLETYEAEHIISSMPIRELITHLQPALPPEVLHAANSLNYRDFLTVGLILKDRSRFTDNWIYIHDSSVKVGRVQNYKSWSPEMVPDPQYSCYGLEYFCFEGDGLWNSSDPELVDLATREIQQIGLAAAEDIVDGCVIRQRKAYPVYDDTYQANVMTIRTALADCCPNLHLVGRNGMHKYNNQDHAMMTALLAARNILAGRTQYDVWEVNQDGEYHESGTAGQQLCEERYVPVESKEAYAG